MGLLSILGKKDGYPAEFKRYKNALRQNPGDQALKAEFIKFCLLNRFTNHEAPEEHLKEALALFEGITPGAGFDLQCHYLVGKYYQELRDFRRAYQVYLEAIRGFNQFIGDHPDLKADNSELAYSVALNLMTLQHDPVDPEVEKCFKLIRKSFPLHLKRIEYESEMAKPVPDRAKIKRLAAEIRKLRAEEEREGDGKGAAQAAVAPKETPKAGEPVQKADPKGTMEAKPAEAHSAPAQEAPKETQRTGPVHTYGPKDKIGFNSKLFEELSPVRLGLIASDAAKGGGKASTDEDEDDLEFFQISPLSNPNFMVFHNDQWEGPFNLTQLKGMDFLKPVTWVCRAGSEQVLQAYEVPDLRPLLKYN